MAYRASRHRPSTISTSLRTTVYCERSVRRSSVGMQYKEFIFENYHYDPTISTLSLRYRFSDGPRFEEQLVFDFVPRQLSAEAIAVLDRIFRLILLMSGVSYYKAFVPPTLI